MKQADGSGETAAMHFARAVVRWRHLVVGFWLAAAVAGSLLLPSVEQAKTGTLGDLVPTNAEAIDTEVRSVELFSFPVLSRTVVVEKQRGGLDRFRAAEIFRRTAALDLGQLPGLEGIPFALAVTDDLLSDLIDARPSSALTYLFFPPDIGPVGQTGLAERLVERHVAGPGIDAGVTGAVPARGEQLRSISASLPLVELVTVIVITLIVGLYFRALVAPLANLVTVALAYTLSVRLLGGIGQAVGISIPEEVEPVMVALLFGIVTDYVVFFLSRFRRELLAGEADPGATAIETTARLTPIIFTAGISVAAAAGALIVARLGFFQAFGPGLALAVLIALAVVLTLVPAMLGLLGRHLFWPGSPQAGEEPSDPGSIGGTWWFLQSPRAIAAAARSRLLGFPVRRPVLAIVATLVPLLVLSAATLKLSLANTLISGLPVDSPPKQALRLAGEDFPAGAIAPTMLLVEEPGIEGKAAALDRLQRLLAARRNVALVVGPGEVPEPLDFGATISPVGGAVRYLIVFDLDPFGARAIRTVKRLRDDLDGRLLANAGLPDAQGSVAGDTALSEETVRKTSEDLARIGPVAVVVVFVILAAFLRAIVAPIYLVLASLLGLTGSLGLTVLVFQDLLGYGQLSFFVPFAGFVLLIALGSDYNVYLVGRVWAEARDRPLPEAVAVAGARATSAITIAALVLALSFGALSLVPLQSFRELAFLLAAGLLIDAFLVRTILAPALITLVGVRSGWPGGALRRVQLPPPLRRRRARRRNDARRVPSDAPDDAAESGKVRE